ncbi:MAG: hypothetical protein Unbinned585contig1001_5 [Prokaryotic dsDNA virus sp.]|nr:MAG: hypothetical protein Unbinned585contig1001_5 [Prokaryotic dsDNA virus sp.]|tara:strand:- start:4578 stop:4916 length:339 start_codon:yes stop_codon:yes gene_type:complete
MKEYQLQKAVCKYLDLNNVLYCGSMGGQYQVHFSQRIKAKKSGYKKGFPDLFIYEPRGDYYGLAIELKVGYNKPTKEQLYWQKELNKRNYKSCVCKGIDEALDTIINYLNES